VVLIEIKGAGRESWWTHTVNNLPNYFLIFSFNRFAESLKRDGNTKINAKVTKEKP